MSKASLYAAAHRQMREEHQRQLSTLPLVLGFGCGSMEDGTYTRVAAVDNDGRLSLTSVTLGQKEALALAAWITDAFGEAP